MKLFGYLCMGVVLGFAIAYLVLPIPALPPVPAPVYQVGGSECYTLSGFADEANNGVQCAPMQMSYGPQVWFGSDPVPNPRIADHIEQGDGSLPDAPMVKAWGQWKRPRHRRKACDAGLFVTRGSRTEIPLRSDGGWRPEQHIEQLHGILGDGPQGDAYTLDAPERFQWKPQPKPQ